MNDRGYTLIELLVVLVLVSIISVAVAGGLHFGTQVWRSVDDRASIDGDILQAQRILRSLVGLAVPRLDGAYVRFDGTGHRLSYEAIPPEANPASRLVHIEISVPDGQRQTAFRIAVRAADQEIHRSQIAANSSDLEFSYLDATQSVPLWLDRWRDRDRLPDAIRIAGGDGNSRRHWPDLVIELPLKQLAGCQFDPVSTICRN